MLSTFKSKVAEFEDSSSIIIEMGTKIDKNLLSGALAGEQAGKGRGTISSRTRLCGQRISESSCNNV